MEKNKTYSEWTLIPWDGNPGLKHQCWRKSFHHGHVSVGVGNFDLIVYSYGPNSDMSCSSTRDRKAHGIPNISEREAMRTIDQNDGYWRKPRLQESID